ncbi:MupG family TIM beta-alpha barrel fold protein [Neobacillus drentensis]|uniref:DUF871 domain-containing protein n=1 Tax=Neobacillus drentensis TaxID=220684 RepID=UPI002FFE3D62
MYGISIYPYKEDSKETIEYIDLAAKYGFQRVFTNLLMIEEEKVEETIEKMKAAIKRARLHQMEVVLDVNPQVFKQLRIDSKDLSFFQKMGATGIRLDANFDGLTESLMTYDSTELDIEINISNNTGYLENIISFSANKKKIIGCHNFYPQRFTGLDYNYFIECSKKYKKLGIRTAAFVGSQHAIHGPHPHTDGLCTLEMHRDWDIEMQAKHLIATQLIDDIIIANSFASEDELKRLAALNQEQLELDITFLETATKLEREIAINNQHLNRGDINSYTIRSSYLRSKYKNASIPLNSTIDELKFGDITIGNDSFGQYKSELNIVKKDLPNHDHFKNVVARIKEEDLFLISYIEPWGKFRLREK